MARPLCRNGTECCVEVGARERPFWEVNIPEGIDRIESRLKEAGME